MWQNIASVIYSLINVVGTIWAVLSILKMKPSEVYNPLTLGGITESNEPLLIQKEQASFGVAWVVVGFVLQSINTFVIVDSLIIFLEWMLFTVVILGAVCYIVHRMNTKFREEYNEYKEKQTNNG